MISDQSCFDDGARPDVDVVGDFEGVVGELSGLRQCNVLA
jgi:hypothetical protein